MELADGAQLQAGNEGEGDGGNININAVESVRLDGRSSIFSRVEDGVVGNAGNITIAAETLQVLGSSDLDAGTAGQGEAGTIAITATTAEIFEGSTASTQSFGQGDGGSISIDAERLTIRNSTLLTSAITDGNFSSGSVSINRGENPSETERVVVLRNGDIITSTNFTGNEGNRGDGGNIFISAARIEATDDTDIIASSINGQGGDITLFNFTADNGPEFADFNYDNNDIVNISVEGDPNGELAPPSLTEDPPEPDPDPTFPGPGDDGSDDDEPDDDGPGDDGPGDDGPGNDGPGNDGPGNDGPDDDGPSEGGSGDDGLGDERLPPDPALLSINDALIFDRRDIDTEALVQSSRIDTDNLIANSCFVRNEDDTGTFIITGAGGLQNRPGSSRPSLYSTGNVQPVSAAAGWQPGDPIVEPEGVYQLPNGELVLSHRCSK